MATESPGQPEEEKKRRRPRGDGGLWWNERRQRWIAEVTTGYTPSGKRKVTTASDRSKSKALKKLQQKLRDRDDGLPSEDGRYTVAQTVKDWLDHGLANRSPETRVKCSGLAENHIIPFLGARKLAELTADEVDDWLADRARRLSTDSLRQVRSILLRSITRAQKRDKVKRNVVQLCDVPPGLDGRPSKSLTIKQASALIEAAEGTAMYCYIVLSLLTGIRTEELRALTWAYVVTYVPSRREWVSVAEAGWDQEQFAIYVWRSVRAGGKTKTKKSRRSLALPRRCVDALRYHQALQRDQQKEAGAKWQEHGLVIASRVGTRRNANNIIRSFRAVLARVPELTAEDWTPRELRHSFVSILSAAGVSIEEISRLAGHKSTEITETVYWHQLRPTLLAGAEAMDSVFPVIDEGA
ncbi:site-specific integrase [Actinomadura harenae]|uniref:Site-specific integrase n=1 Tax=Actinomadura harenae TaxID=2483351 RepID=A0A3M2M8I1_9ACTN|nr:tyrosine-type recombinase/integrase [Actinomadura harenae]RMI45290.1 site-specific integrase [Actinomadura harenae]